VQASAVFASINVSNFSKAAGALGFMIDVSDQTGARAFEDLIHGNVAAAQKLAASSDSAVKYFSQASSNQVAGVTNLFIGIPVVLFASFNNGLIHDYATTRSLESGERAHINYGIYLNEQNVKLITITRKQTEAFYGSAFQLINKEGGAKGYFGQYVWTYANDRAVPNDVRYAVNEVSVRTGLGKWLALNVPDTPIGFASVTLKVTFSETQTQRLMKRAHLLSAYPYMYYPLIEMRAAISRGDDKRFTDAYARFGAGMMQDASSFQAALKVAGSGVQLGYTVQGTNISRVNTMLESTNSPRHFNRVQRGG
jgi:hypothetical protein